MRITRIAVEAFGVWNRFEAAELSDQLNVFYGPNEAGKTTLLDFIRSVLYGFSPARRARYLPPQGDGRPGGVLTVADKTQTYQVARFDDDPLSADLPMISTGGHSARDPQAMAAIMGDVDESVFNNVFAIGLEEIQQLSTLSATEAAAELYNLTLGGNRISLVGVLGDLESSRQRLLARDGSPSLVAQLEQQRDRLQREIRDLSGATTQYLELSEERRGLEAEVGRLTALAADWERRAREAVIAQSLSERWQRRESLAREIALLADMPALADDALARYERISARLTALRQRIRKTKRAATRLRQQMAQLPVNDALCRQALRLEALGEQQPWMTTLAERIARLESEVRELELQRAEAAKHMHLSGESRAAESLSKADVAELRAAANGLSQSRRQFRNSGKDLESAAQSASQMNSQIATALAGHHDRSHYERGLTRALGESGQLMSQLRRRIQLDERLDQLGRRETELEEQVHEHFANQVLPTWALVGLGSLFVLGCALVLLCMVGLVLPSLSGALGWPLGLVGVGAAGAAAAMKFALEHASSRQLATCEEQLDTLRQQMKESEAERDQLDAQLPKGGGPLVVRLQAAEKAHARLEALLPLESQREASQHEIDAIQAAHRRVEEAYQTQKRRWRQLLATRRLPAGLNPKQLKSYLQSREALRVSTSRLQERQQELLARRAEYDALAGRIRQSAVEGGIAVSTQPPLELLRQCLAALAAEQVRQKQRDELARQLAERQLQHRKRSRSQQIWRRRRQRLLLAAGALDETEFRRRAQLRAEVARLKAEHATLNSEIAVQLAVHLSEERLAQLLADPRGMALLAREATDAAHAAQNQLHAAHHRRGELSLELKSLVDNRRLPMARLELNQVDSRISAAIKRWQVLTVCGQMFASVREYFEREHQPDALKEASTYLARMTEGRYTRVWTPLGEHSLRVDDESGRSLGVEVLSRGTREQLFLALRLALASSYARRGIHLPLVLDDVLVNFDVARARATGNVLRDFSRAGHQILVFTCHEHIAKMFRQLKAEVRELPHEGEQDPESEPVEPLPRRAGKIRRDDPHPLREPTFNIVSSPHVALPRVVPMHIAPPRIEPVAAETFYEDWPRVVVATNWLASLADFTYQTHQPAVALESRFDVVAAPQVAAYEPPSRVIHDVYRGQTRRYQAESVTSVSHFDDADAA